MKTGLVAAALLGLLTFGRAAEPPKLAAEKFHDDAKSLVRLTFDTPAAETTPKEFDYQLAKAAKLTWKTGSFSQAVSRPFVLQARGSDPSEDDWSYAFFQGHTPRDAEIAVSFMVVEPDQKFAAALVWRHVSDGDGYRLEANSDNDQLRLVRTKKGKQKVIDVKDVIITPNRWHKLRVIFLAQTYTVYLNDDMVMAGRDKKILDAGRAGIASAGHGLVYFDDVELRGMP
jgi:hypothetical protein